MRQKKQIIQGLLESLSILEEFHEPPETIFKRLVDWLDRANAILDGDDMLEESHIWRESTKGMRFSDDYRDYTLDMAIKSVKIALFRILNKLEFVEISQTPYLEHDEIMNAYKMSELYIVLHCYENSVRRLIEKVLYQEFGSDWWEKKATAKMKNDFNQRKQRETNEQWLSPRGTSPLFYIQWGDLVKLIKNNEQIFLPYIGNIQFVDSRLGELEKLRNIVAHNGVVTSEDDFQRAIIAFRDWNCQIGKINESL